ncbi:MAG: nucleotide exchange factor GrpE [FCB group bacterium]|nr:nucleotide exchange factor GrpE [FCB group bacterium]
MKPKAKKTQPKSAVNKQIVKLEEKISAMEEQIVQITEEREKSRENNIRLLAEFDNYKRRTSGEKSRLLKYSCEGIAVALLPVLDDLERTISASENPEGKSSPLLDGIMMVRDKFNKLLKENGIEPFESVDQSFDPERHEALMSQESDDYPENTVIQEFEKGYVYHDRIIRHAKVIVSKPKSVSEEKN